MKKITLFMTVLLFTALQSWSAAVGQEATPVITVNADVLDFGELSLGYPRTSSFTVTGANLSDDVILTVDGGNHAFQYHVTPASITPQEAAAGVRVTVKMVPVFYGTCDAHLVLASGDADDVVIPMTAHVNDVNATVTHSTTLSFFATVGQMTTSTEVLRWADAEVPHDPNTPVVRTPGQSTTFGKVPDLDGLSNYSFELSGDGCFGYYVVKASDIVKTSSVKIVYHPTNEGPHQATLTCSCPGSSTIVITLEGRANPCIADVTSLIDLLLGDDDMPNASDMNADGMVSIADVTFMIDRIINCQ